MNLRHTTNYTNPAILRDLTIIIYIILPYIIYSNFKTLESRTTIKFKFIGII